MSQLDVTSKDILFVVVEFFFLEFVSRPVLIVDIIS